MSSGRTRFTGRYFFMQLDFLRYTQDEYFFLSDSESTKLAASSMRSLSVLSMLSSSHCFSSSLRNMTTSAASIQLASRVWKSWLSDERLMKQYACVSSLSLTHQPSLVGLSMSCRTSTDGLSYIGYEIDAWHLTFSSMQIVFPELDERMTSTPSFCIDRSSTRQHVEFPSQLQRLLSKYSPTAASPCKSFQKSVCISSSSFFFVCSFLITRVFVRTANEQQKRLEPPSSSTKTFMEEIVKS